jgi:hypothetical protein
MIIAIHNKQILIPLVKKFLKKVYFDMNQGLCYINYAKGDKADDETKRNDILCAF